MLNRTIRLKYNGLTSRELGVHKGVPQGSALGPILWNYAIEDIHKLFKSSPTLELVAYADDLTIISHGNEQPETTQNLLNQIDNFIRSKGLEISAEKSELMHIIGPGTRPKPDDLPSYSIGGRRIDQKDYMKILGVPIDKHMQLRIEDEDTWSKLAKAKKLLRYLRMYNVIDNTKDWKILFEALVKSLLIQNFIPMLAVDPRARIWADKNFLYTMMYTFCFPRFTSHNLLQTMLQVEDTAETVQKQLIAGSTDLNTSPQQRESYITLEEILLHGDLLSHIEKKASL